MRLHQNELEAPAARWPEGTELTSGAAGTGHLRFETQGENMGVVRIYEPETERYTETHTDSDSMNWTRIAAGGSLLLAGFLLATGKRRAGLAAAATGTTLAALDQQEAVRAWWNALPGYINNVQEIITQVQDSVEQVAAQRDRLHKILSR
jgi:hypothetical protein